MHAYHEVHADSLGSILEDGLKRTSRGTKGDDSAIIRADQLLDRLRPASLRDAGVSRDDNVYAYVSRDGHVIDIVTGSLIPLEKFVTMSDQVVLSLELDTTRCWVSDLDRYDKVLDAVERGQAKDTVNALAHAYWQALVPLQDYTHSTFRRPEIMITYDLPPQAITIATSPLT